MTANKIHTGFDGFCNDIYGLFKRLAFSLKKLKAQSETVMQTAALAAELNDDIFASEIEKCKALVRKGKTGGASLQVLGYICNASRMSIGIMPYAEQIMGALLMSGNYVIQMQTGEGKTITGALAAVLSCWRGSPCHIVTSNDYLAKRDASLMKDLYETCGLTVSFVIGGMNPFERKAAYEADIVYSTSKELLADFLRDRLSGEATDSLISQRKPVMRGLHTAIIDEADSVLADEATVPLIISVAGKNRLLKEAVMTALSISQTLVQDIDYVTEQFHSDIKITQQGRAKIESVLKDLPAVWSSYERSEYLIKQALLAQHFYQRDVHYLVYEGKIIIVDEKTGRMMEGRNWSGGLHQAVEAKEGVELTDVTESHIQMSFQMFFRLYKRLAGMSGTLQNIERELWSVYGLIAVKIPTHVLKKLTKYPDKIFKTLEDKWAHTAREIKAQSSKGRAVLAGTRSIKDSEELYARLKDFGIDATVLNAVKHEQEAEIIAQAGKSGMVTIATNMAGRGTDIKADKETLEAGGLHVLATERHESRRVDMQLFGRTARQGQPGSGQMMLSLQDEVFSRFAPVRLAAWLSSILHTSIGRWTALAFYIYYQHCAEKLRSRLRKRILQQDMMLNRNLSFTKY